MKKADINKRNFSRITSLFPESISFKIHGKIQKFTGLLYNHGPDGIGIIANVIIPPRTFIDISPEQNQALMQEDTFIGEIRWCLPLKKYDNKYLLGIASHADHLLK